MKTIKQPDNWSCVLCCVQMVTFCDRQELIKIIASMTRDVEKDGVDHHDFIPFLFGKGVLLGSVFKDLEAPPGYTMDDIDEVVSRVIVRGDPAFVTVKSWRFPGKSHFVLWDGYKIRDPNPDTDDTNKLSEYEITEYEQIRFRSPVLLEKFTQFYR